MSMDYEKLAREITRDDTPGSLLEDLIAKALERAALEARIEQAWEDGQLALRVHDEELPNDDVHCPDEVTRRIQHEVIPALRARLDTLKAGTA